MAPALLVVGVDLFSIMRVPHGAASQGGSLGCDQQDPGGDYRRIVTSGRKPVSPRFLQSASAGADCSQKVLLILATLAIAAYAFSMLDF
jgi:hypothetical protein